MGRVLTAAVAALATGLLMAAGTPPAGAADGSQGSGWRPHETGTTRGLLGVSFADRQHGFAVGREGVIVATRDGGHTWQQQFVCLRSSPCTSDADDRLPANPAVDRDQLRDVSFADRDHGYAVGVGGRIVATDDGGDTWTLQASPTTDSLNGVEFVDADHGYAVGGQTFERSIIVATDDGGQTWTRQRSVEPEQFRDVDFVDTEHGWAVGTKGTVPGNVVGALTGVTADEAVSPEAAVVATDDGGATWNRQSSGTDENLFGVSFVDAQRGWAVGDNGTILATADGGRTWTPQDSGTDQNLRGVEFTDADHGHVVGSNGTVLATDDGGESWTTQDTGTTVFLSDVSFVDVDHGYVSGGVGTVLTTRDGGDGQPSLPGAVAGTVTDADTEAAIKGAALTVTDDDSHVVGTGQTGSAGAYVVEQLPAGTYTVEASAAGFEAQSTAATVEADETTPVDFALQPDTEAQGEEDDTAVDGDGLPGSVADLVGVALGTDVVELSWRAVSDGVGGVSGEYLVAQSGEPIEGPDDFESAQKLCDGVCVFQPPPRQAGDPVELRVGGLNPATTYHYAVAAMAPDGRRGPISEPVAVTTEADRGTEAAGGATCPGGEVPTADFADRDQIPDAHRLSVDCAAWSDIVAGFADDTYRPAIPVRRDQMATFVAGMLEAADAGLPEPRQQRFDDVPADSAHDEAIHRLAAAGIVLGGPQHKEAGSYGPELRIRRDQMAALLVRAAEFATGEELSSHTQAFDDVAEGNVHFADVNGAAEADYARGFGDGTYGPASEVRRDQMASFVIRVLEDLGDDTADTD